MFNAFACLVQTLLYWQLSRTIESDGPAARRTIGVFILFNLGHAALATRYFIVTPIVFDLVIGLLLGAALAAPRPAPCSSTPPCENFVIT